jgi:hypothetical protein
MDVSQLVQFIDTHKHLGRVELCMFFLEHARVVQQCTEITTRDVFLQINRQRSISSPLNEDCTHHCKIDMFAVLESI